MLWIGRHRPPHPLRPPHHLLVPSAACDRLLSIENVPLSMPFGLNQPSFTLSSTPSITILTI